MTKEKAKEFIAQSVKSDVDMALVADAIQALGQEPIFDKIRAEIEQLPIKTRTNWDGCCPDIDYPEIEYIDVTKKQLLQIIDKCKPTK